MFINSNSGYFHSQQFKEVFTNALVLLGQDLGMMFSLTSHPRNRWVEQEEED